MGVSRRDLLKTGLMAPAVAAAHGMGPLAHAIVPADGHTGFSEGATESPFVDGPTGSSPAGSGRERLLLDFGWRFHLGNADDPTKDFGFGSSEHGNFQKTGNFLPAGMGTFDDSDWRPVDLPHDWAIELPFTNDPSLQSKGFYPLGRKYPDTSVGWYRRVFELTPEDKGKRLTLEFDGAYRESMVVFNGFYIGTHTGGYDPFTFDVTDFANPGGRNVLLVRVDATSSDGWFYEGAGIYRHVWMVKTNPVHVKQWGTFVASKVERAVQLRFPSGPNSKTTRNNREQPVFVRGSLIRMDRMWVARLPRLFRFLVVKQRRASNRSWSAAGKLWSLEESETSIKLVTEVQRRGGAIVDQLRDAVRHSHGGVSMRRRASS